MKRHMALLLAAALGLTLAACGGEGMSKEEMLEAAEPCNFGAIRGAYGENKLNAEETYCGKLYQVTGYVQSIEAEYAVIGALDSPLGNSAPAVGDGKPTSVDVYLSEEELKQLSTNEVVNVVGELTSIDPSGYTMENACYVDNVITLTGEITNFVIDTGLNQHIMLVEEKVPEYGGGMSYREYEYQVASVTAFENMEEVTIDGVTAAEGDTVTITGTASFQNITYSNAGTIYFYTAHLTLDSITSITEAEAETPS